MTQEFAKKGEPKSEQQQQQQQQQLEVTKGIQKKLKWPALEANPDVWNKIIHENGVDPSWSFVDILGFEPELLALLPRPTVALIFLFPITQAYEDYREKEDARLRLCEQNISPNLMYFRQTISNACGMMALLHSIANNDHLVIGPGVFTQIIRATRSMSPEERAGYLENCEELARVHETGAHEGQTELPDLKEQLRLHFVCFTIVDNHLYELDGRRAFPINHGQCGNLIDGATDIIKQYMQRDPLENEYSAIAFVKTAAI